MASMTTPTTESIPSPLSPELAILICEVGDVAVSRRSSLERGLGRARSSLSRRIGRPAKYPTPFDKYFKQLEFWKVIAMFWTIAGCVGTFVGLNLISNEFTRLLLVLLSVATFSLVIAHALQDMVPELAMLAMLTGIAMMIGMFHTVVFELLHLTDEQFRLAVSLLLVAYSLLLVVTLYKVFKEDVREKEVVKENKSSGDDTVPLAQELICTPTDAAHATPSPK